MSRTKYVYKHIDSNKDVFYIGCGGKYRPHSVDSRNKSWNIKAKEIYCVEVVDVLEMEDAIQMEIKLISDYGLENLTNVRPGGHGVKSFIDKWDDINPKTNKSKTLTISLTDEMKQMAKDQSMVTLGTENISGYFAYLLRKEHKTLSNETI